MKVLVAASGNASYISPFILDQTDLLKKKGVQVEFFLIKGKGILGYFKNYKKLLSQIETSRPDIIHAHYGLTGLLCALQRKVPVITTFHGSDVNIPNVRFFSKIADRISSKSIFVSNDLAKKLKRRRPIVIPCGIDLEMFYPVEKEEARRKMQLEKKKKYILFSSSFNNSVKNYPLAKSAIESIKGYDITTIELKGYSRIEVMLLMNAVDLVLMTSFTEGSPQFVKEAMSCNCPIVSTDVGDVKEVIGNTKGCYITDYDVADVKMKIQEALNFEKRTDGRRNILHFDNELIIKEIMNMYELSMKN